MQKKTTYLVIGGLLILSGLLAKFGHFGNHELLHSDKPQVAADSGQKAQSTWAEQEKIALEHLSEQEKLEYTAIADTKDELTMAEKSDFWRKNEHFSLYGHYIAEKTKLEKTENSFTFATPLLIEILREEHSPAVKSLIADDIMSLCKLGNDFFGNKDEWEYAEAVALIEGKNETMPGVQKLLAITRKDPKNLEANLLLAKLAIESGQNDKSIKRLTDLLAVYPDNTEAMFFLAEAYKASGEVDKAKEWLEKCKEKVNNPDFTAEIDDYIKTF